MYVCMYVCIVCICDSTCMHCMRGVYVSNTYMCGMHVCMMCVVCSMYIMYGCRVSYLCIYIYITYDIAVACMHCMYGVYAYMYGIYIYIYIYGMHERISCVVCVYVHVPSCMHVCI